MRIEGGVADGVVGGAAAKRGEGGDKKGRRRPWEVLQRLQNFPGAYAGARHGCGPTNLPSHAANAHPAASTDSFWLKIGTEAGLDAETTLSKFEADWWGGECTVGLPS